MNENATDPFHDQQSMILRDIKNGLLVPVLGGDINLCGRPRRNGIPVGWQEQGDGLKFPPSTSELALHLLDRAIKRKKDYQNNAVQGLPDSLSRLFCEQLGQDQEHMSVIGLANVCQYIQFVDSVILDGLLPEILAKKYRPTPVHDFLVKLAQYRPDPAIADTPPYPCIVNACFDQVLEQQFRENNIPFHLVAFVLGENGGEFQYTPPGELPEVSSHNLSPEDVTQLSEGFKEHPVMLKLNGGFWAENNRNFAITENHYIDYLTRRDNKNAMPAMLLSKLTKRGKRDNSRLLFLGYSIRHWNLRVILRDIWSESLSDKKNRKRWTILLEKGFSDIDRNFWLEYEGVTHNDLLNIDSLESYIRRLTERLADLPAGTSSREPNIPGLIPLREKAQRDCIFFSYSHKDQKWLEKLKTMMAPVRDKLNAWDDQMIKPGAKWREEIGEALASAKAAVLLVSPDFLASEFIQKNELPPLLEAARSKGCVIFWIKVKDCLVDATVIDDYQALYAGEPLISLTEGKLNKVLAQIARDIVKYSVVN